MKKIIVLLGLTLCLMVPMALAEEAQPEEYNPADITVVGEGFTVLKITGLTAKNISKECQCNVAVVESQKLVLLLFPEEVGL